MNICFKHTTIVLLLCIAANSTFAQLSGTGCLGATSYTDGQPNDPIFYYPNGQLGQLTVVPEVAGASFNFVWSRFVPGNNNWSAFTVQNNLASSTISNLQPGAYFVSVRNTANVIVGCYRAWIAQVIQEPMVDVLPIPSNCVGPVSLNGTFTPGQVSPISNLPESQLIIDANTQISVCFTGTHTFISDLGFYLKGPASCGSPNLALMPNPGGACNASNNFSNFCFSTESNNNINVCGGVTGLSGTYGTYGPTATAINWASIFGCDAMNGGWAVQVYDCIGIDVGTLTDATITFIGTDLCGAIQSVTYTTPAGFSSAIFDNSCSSASASIFTVSPAVSPTLLDCSFGFEWSSDPYVYIADSTTSLNIDLSALSDANGAPMAWQDIDFTLMTTINCDVLASQNDCFGGNGSDTESYVNIPQTLTAITDISAICISGGNVQLTADVPGGTWSGAGIIDAALGIFDPILAGEGSFMVDYSFANPCVLPDNTTITVEVEPNLTLNLPVGVCEDVAPFNLSIAANDGVFSGAGIIDPLLGTFDPALAGVGVHPISLISNTVCPITLNDVIEVFAIPVLVVSPNADVCPGEDVQVEASGAASYAWTPADYLNSNNVSGPFVSLGETTTYTVVGTSTDGCEALGQVTLTLLESPVVSVTPPALTCPGNAVTLSVLGSAGMYEWSLADGTLLGAGPTIDVVFDVTTIVEVQVTDDCLSTAVAQVAVPFEAMPSIYTGLDEVLCAGSTVQLTADVTGIYVALQWSTTDGVLPGASNVPTIQISDEGTYQAIITTALGCTYADIVFVNVVPLPVIDAGSSTAVCGGQSHPLLASGANTYSWFPTIGLSSAFIASPTTIINAPTTYTVTGTDGNGCVNTDQISLGIIAPPQLSAQSVSMICPGAEVELIASGSAGDYVWSPNSALNSTSGISVIASPMVTTQYTVALTDECGVVLQVPVNVPVEQLYTVDAGDDTGFCEGESAQVVADVTGANPSIGWFANAGAIAGENDNSINITIPGTYAIQVETPLGCVYDDAIIVNEIAYPTFFLADTLSYCQGSSVAITVQGTWDLVQWSTGSTLPQISVSQEGDYQVAVSNNGCVTNDEVHVYRVELPNIQLGPNVEICQGETVTLSCGYDGVWSTGSSGDSLVVATANTYSFEYSEDGCTVSDAVEVVVNPLPYIDAVTTQYGCIDQPYTIVINDYAAGNYQWIDGSQSPYLTVDQPGDYWFTVTNECGSSAETISVVLEDCDEAVYIPNCFTPDNDGVNDAWKIITRNITWMSTRVLNRWGQVVFQSDELAPVWTGGFNSGDTFVGDGLYFFRVEFARLDGQKELREGSMFILR